MAIAPSANFLAQLSQKNKPHVVLEVALDSGTVKWAYAKDSNTSDALPIIKSVSSLQNKLDPKSGYASRGQITIVISGRDYIKALISAEYLKNRRVVYKTGFLGLAYADYCAMYSGKITEWSRKGDELTLIVADDMVETSKKIPAENATKTQYIDYRNTAPMSIVDDILTTQLSIGAGYVDSAALTSEGSTWLGGWKFDRVITEPREAKDYLNELQVETISWLFHDGEKITGKVFAPPLPGQTVEEYTDAYHIQNDSLSAKSGYRDNFYNRVVVYYDYDESGSDKEDNYEAAVISIDSASQSSAEWDETSTKVIKSKWMRSRTYTQASNVTGVVLYHISRNNGTGSGTLTYNATNKTLTWTPPGATVGEAVNVTKDGKYQVFGADKTKWIRVIVTYASLAGGNQSDTITISSLGGETYATTIANKLLSHYRNPPVTVTFSIDLNNIAYGGYLIRPTDLKDITTNEPFEKGDTTWVQERCMLLSVRPDFSSSKIDVEAIESKMYRRYMFIAPAGYPDYGSATAAQKEYWFIGDANNKVNSGGEDGYYIWALPLTWLALSLLTNSMVIL